jgi:cytoskeletal protein RodZ
MVRIDWNNKANMGFSWIFLEAAFALVILLAIVWWTMFAGRSKGELKKEPPQAEATDAKPSIKH